MKKIFLFAVVICLMLSIFIGCTPKESGLTAEEPGTAEPETVMEPEDALQPEEPAAGPTEEPAEEIDEAMTFTWMGYKMKVAEFYVSDPKTEFGPTTTYTAKGQIVVVRFDCVDSKIPTDTITDNADACFWIEDAAGTMGSLDALLLTTGYTGVGFDSDSGTFYTNEEQDGFSLSFDVPADIDVHDFLICVDTMDGDPSVVKIPVASAVVDKTAE